MIARMIRTQNTNSFSTDTVICLHDFKEATQGKRFIYHFIVKGLHASVLAGPYQSLTEEIVPTLVPVLAGSRGK